MVARIRPRSSTISSRRARKTPASASGAMDAPPCDRRRGSPMSPGESAVRDGRVATYLCVRVNANARVGGSASYPGGSWDEWWMPTISSAPARSRLASVPSAQASSTTGAAGTQTFRSPSRGSPLATSGPGLMSTLGPADPPTVSRGGRPRPRGARAPSAIDVTPVA